MSFQKFKEDVTDNVIYTDYQKSKDNISDAFDGWLFHYSNYLMQQNIQNEMGMKKYALRFITRTMRTYEKFKNTSKEEKNNKFDAEEIIPVLDIYDKIINKEKVLDVEYNYLNRFFTKYLDITGLSDPVREKDDINHSILKNR